MTGGFCTYRRRVAERVYGDGLWNSKLSMTEVT
jgi:hypothetical protein